MGGAGLPFIAAPASAADIDDAITNVNVVENSINSGVNTMRLEVEFAIGAGIGRNGTAQGGDTFWLQMDPRLSAPSGTFDVYAIGSSTDVVATVTMTSGGRATFTLTDYVNNRSFTEGAAFWGFTFRSNTTPAGPYDLTFETAVRTYTEPVVVQSTYNPGTGGVNPPLISGIWQDFDQRNGTWKVILPNGPATSLVFESDGWTSGPEWRYDCARTLANTNAYRSLWGSAVEVSIQCTADHVRWELANVPQYGSVGLYPTLQIDFDVVDPSRSGDLVFRNPTTYTIDDGTAQGLNGEARQTRGGGALGPTTPTIPTVTQSVCAAGSPTDPDIALPQNGSGVTYSRNLDDYGPGDTVEVIADLSTGYEWDLPLDAAWEVVSDAVAVYTIVLDEPDCVLTPVNPTVTQASCTGSSVVDPVITFAAAAPGISYSTSPAVYGPGDSVLVVATLDGTDYQWDDLPNGWVRQSPTVATRSYTLDDAPDCRLVATPANPTVAQTSCLAGSQVAPDVQQVADGGGIAYRTEGDIEAGETVRVFATLTGPEYRWPSSLPTGWVAQSAIEAVFTVDLVDPTCTTPVVPVDPTVMQTTCSAGDVVLPDVDLATGTAGIRYAIDGTVAPGATVRVIATLAGPEYVWGGGLATGWDIRSASTAVFSIVLDPANCGMGDSDLASTGLGAAVLPIGIVGGGILLLGGLVLLTVRMRRGVEKS